MPSTAIKIPTNKAEADVGAEASCERPKPLAPALDTTETIDKGVDLRSNFQPGDDQYDHPQDPRAEEQN